LQRRLKRLVSARKQLREGDYQVREESAVPTRKRRAYEEIVRWITASAPTKHVAEAMVKRIGKLMSRTIRR